MKCDYPCVIRSVFALTCGHLFGASFQNGVIEGDLQVVRTSIDSNPELVRTPWRDFIMPGHINTDETPLHVAAFLGRIEVADFLVMRKGEIDAGDSLGWTPLHWAVLRHHTEVVRLLLAKGADVNSKNRDGYTPMHWAASTGRTELIKLLLTKHADVNAKGNDGSTPLHFAASSDRKEATELLVASGADINSKTDAGETPLALAVFVGCDATAEWLRLHGGHK